MARKIVLSEEEEDEIEVGEGKREDPVDPKDSDDKDEEEDEEGEDEYEKYGFTVDDVDEEEEDSDDERARRKKRKLEKKYVLDEDDYELLQDNNITGFRRPKVKVKKFKRLKKATADAGYSDKEEYNGSGKGRQSEVEKNQEMMRILFGGDEDSAMEDDIEEEDQPQEEEDEMADFIVDEPTRRRKKVNKKKSRRAPRVSSSAIQEARDIFGDVDELLRQRKLVLKRISRYDDIDEKERRLEEELESLRKRKSIKKNKYQVFLICRESKTMDPYRYDQDHDNCKSKKEKAFKANKYLKSRMIVHPCFRDTTADEAIEMMSDKEPGEIIVRPSSRGPSYLTLTLKVYDGVYVHKHIIEGGKENANIISKLRLGKTLKIGDDVFEDLDELMDRYVDPLVSRLKTMLGHRKFIDGVKTEVDETLRKEKFENPSRIVYSFGISHEHPGMFIFTYIRSSNLHHEYVGLYPKGFKFRNKIFVEIDRLVAYFQRHIDDPQKAAMVN